MAIRRSKIHAQYTVISNETLNSGLSFPALGLLAHLLSKPENWTVSVGALVRLVERSERPTGRDGVYALLRELIAAGYVTREQIRDDSGRMGKTDYVVYDMPQAHQEHTLPCADEADTDDRHTPEPHEADPYADETTQQSNYNNKILIHTKPQPPAERECDTDAFEGFWSAYPRKVGKAAARKAWTVALKGGATPAVIAAGLNACNDIWPGRSSPEARFIPYPATWLNQGRWQDDPQSGAATSRGSAPMTTQEKNMRDLMEHMQRRNGGRS